MPAQVDSSRQLAARSFQRLVWASKVLMPGFRSAQLPGRIQSPALVADQAGGRSVGGER